MKRNYQREMEEILDLCQREGITHRLLLHSCCAPCSSYVLEYLSRYFKITVYYYNPNIYPAEEFDKRLAEQEDLTRRLPGKNPIGFVGAEHRDAEFYRRIKGMEHLPEGKERCAACYRLRLEETARLAGEMNFDYFTTTLSISPLKRADWLNEIGEEAGKQYQVPYLVSDFKKKNGYKRSVELSSQYDLYRQNYCGCVYSMLERQGEEKGS